MRKIRPDETLSYRALKRISLAFVYGVRLITAVIPHADASVSSCGVRSAHTGFSKCFP